jgi:hypothetical protein
VRGDGLDAVREMAGPAAPSRCSAVPGAGKSTLVNALAGTPVMRCSGSGADGKGRHTTAYRGWCRCPAAALCWTRPASVAWVCSTPVPVWTGTFADLADLAAQCRFGDCRHEAEPGCAIAAALADGSLSPRRLESWRKLHREVEVESARRTVRWPRRPVAVAAAIAPSERMRGCARSTKCPGRGRSRLRRSSPPPARRWGDAGAGLSYLVLSLLVLSRLWPAPNGRVLSANDDDHGFFLFVMAHGERVLFHGAHPSVSDRLNVPDGVNMMANTSVLALSLPFAPVTHVFGPGVTVALLLTVGLSGTAAPGTGYCPGIWSAAGSPPGSAGCGAGSVRRWWRTPTVR